MRIPMVDLRPMLAATEPAWRSNLDRMFERMHFILGEQAQEFERELAAAFGAKHAVGVGTGTAAIELALRGLGLERGAEVIVPALTSPFTAQAALAAGCRVRFSDVDADHLLMADPPVTKATRAIVPVSLYGQPCAMRTTVKIVQDACQAHGAPLGFSSPAAYSFYPTKNLPCLGDGGAVLTDSAAMANRVRLLRDGGRRNNDQVARVAAVNSRLDEMQACYLSAFLPKLREWNDRRARLAALYDEALAGSAARPIGRREGSVAHLYVVRVGRRERLRERLASHGIATGVHYPVPLHLMPAFRDAGGKRGDFPVAERACREILSLPLHPYLPESAVEEVAERIRQFS